MATALLPAKRTRTALAKARLAAANKEEVRAQLACFVTPAALQCDTLSFPNHVYDNGA